MYTINGLLETVGDICKMLCIRLYGSLTVKMQAICEVYRSYTQQ